MARASELAGQRAKPNVAAQVGLWVSVLLVALVLGGGAVLLSGAPAFRYDLNVYNETRLSLGILKGCPAEVPIDICERYRLHMERHFELSLNEPGVRHVLIAFDLPQRDR